MLYLDHEARRQFARERLADLAKEARLTASVADVDARNRAGFIDRLLQVWPSGKRAPYRAPAFRA